MFKSPAAQKIIEKANRFGARNYAPKEVVIDHAKGCVAYDVDGKPYFDMLSAYSALNFGHCHPELVKTAQAQLGKLTLTSRAFHNPLLGDFYEALCGLTGKDMVLPMNTGAEAVETALKTARRWGASAKGIKNGEQEIVVCDGNFHGRTISIVSFSADEDARGGYGPYTPGFRIIPYGDAQALEDAVNKNTAAFLVEPIQGEAGVIVPPNGYLSAVRDICTRHNILMIADEVQTGFARTGNMFACGHENVEPDIYILGKALGGGIMPVSAIAANSDILGVFTPGSHGSTFGGNPLACAVAIKAMEILVRDGYAQMAREKGAYFAKRLNAIKNGDIVEIRGRGLLIGMELSRSASGYVKSLIENGILAKETHERTIRFAPPIVISYAELDEACDRIEAAFTGVRL